MSFPFSSAEIRGLISQLEQIEAYQRHSEQTQSSQPSEQGYRRGDPRARAVAAGPLRPLTVFPAIPPIAQLWKVVEEAGPDFVGRPFSSIEEGPGPVPRLVEDQSEFVSGNSTEALQRVHIAFTSGFWARAAIETFTAPAFVSDPSQPFSHYIVLRACGLGGYVRFASEVHFELFRDQITAFRSGLVAYGFDTLTELEVFCQGARLAVPPLFEPC